MESNVLELAKSALAEELENLRDEVRGLVQPLSDQQLWAKPTDPGNSVGHLILHLSGNLNHFVGATLGGTGYVRDRNREFTEGRPPARQDLMKGLDDAVAMFRRVVGGLDEKRLSAPHPDDKSRTVYRTLVRLVAHFALHRGQMSYIVRMLERSDSR
jgi:uncharacterized damage-inducible protein DinB